MPYSRPTLTQLRSDASNDMQASLPGADPLLRYSNLRILATVLAGLANQHYGFLDWIAKQAVPFTATDEFLYAWGALKGVTLKAATFAGDASTGGLGGTNFSNSVPGTLIPNGSILVRGDGVQFETTADGTISAFGLASVPVRCLTEGAIGNCAVNTVLTLGSSIPGVQTNALVFPAIVGGADLETQDEFRSRMLQVYRHPPQGGSNSDYQEWALQVPGVTRAWAVQNMGLGTATVYFMEDDSRSSFGGFPQGTDGVATAEARDAPATGDQLLVANHIFPLAPVTAVVYAAAPINSPTAFTIHGITDAAVRTAIGLAIDDVFLANASPGGTVNLLDIEAAISAVPNSDGAVLTVPAANIVAAAGRLSTRGAITWVP